MPRGLISGAPSTSTPTHKLSGLSSSASSARRPSILTCNAAADTTVNYYPSADNSAF